MANLDVSKFVGFCKDFLHDEWSSYKKQNIAKALPVCIYSIGGKKDVPFACIESVGFGFRETERLFKERVYIAVDLNSPHVSHDIMVGVEGEVTILPERKEKSKEENDAEKELKRPPLPGKRSKAPPTPEAAFMGGVEQIANYMLDHLKRVSESCLLNGNIKVLYYVLSSALLIKCRVLTYKQLLKTQQSKALTSALCRCDEMTEMITQHLLNYHSDLIRSSILHDAPSHDWHCDRMYEENEKVSLAVHMWAFYMQGIHNDLWRYTSPKVGCDIFCNIFVDTLGLLVTRYMQIQPSHARLLQMRGDVTAIFLVAASFLPSLIPSPRYYFQGDIQDSVFSIHRRMDLLLRVAALKCAPIETLEKVFSLGIYASHQFSENSKEPTNINCCPAWLTFLNPTLFPRRTKMLSTLPDTIAVYLTLCNAALRPYPDQSLILRGFFMKDFLATKVILRALQDLPGHVGKQKSCEGALCFGHLCTAPLIPHTVYAAILQIVTDSFTSPYILNRVMQSGMKDSGNWDSLDRKQVWNIQRPPWHHALVQLITPYLAPVVSQVLDSVPSTSPVQPTDPRQPSVRLEHHLSAWTLQLINGIADLADSLPRCIARISESVNAFLPPTIKPVGGHVISQLAISAVYSILNSRRSLNQLYLSAPTITDSQWDMMIAIGERLCSLHDNNYDSPLDKMTKNLLQSLSVEVEDEEEDCVDDYTNEEAIEEVCQQMADLVLTSPKGQHSFGIIWEYLKRNMEWITHALKVPPLLSSLTPSPAPISQMFSSVPDIYNPLKYHNRIFYTPFNHPALMECQGNWESVLKEDLWMPKDMICSLIRERPEMQGDVLNESQSLSVQKLKFHLDTHVVTTHTEEL